MTGRPASPISAVRRRAVATASGCLALLIVVYLVAVRTTPGQRFEDSVLVDATNHETMISRWGIQVLDTVTVWSLTVAAGAIVLIGGLRRQPFLGLLAAGVVGASIATTEILRCLVARPILLATGTRRIDQSFPSGHTTVALSIMCALAMVVPRRFRAVTVGLCSLWATGVTLATVATGWHRPSDTTGAGLIVLIWASLAVTMLTDRRHARRISCQAAPDRSPRHDLALSGSGALVVAAVVAIAGRGGSAVAAGGALLTGGAIAWGGGLLVSLAAYLLPDRLDFAQPDPGSG